MITVSPWRQRAVLAWRFDSGPGRDRPPTIVMIEDDPAIAEMYASQLILDGYRVLTANDGEAGLDLVRSARPDLVLLDILLPVMEGFEFLDRLRDDPALAATPVLVLSNYADPRMTRAGIERGARAYLIKSRTTPAELSAHVRRWLGAGGTND
jgi:CheY-like chemotaxis protein